jgi:hypothetical protein
VTQVDRRRVTNSGQQSCGTGRAVYECLSVANSILCPDVLEFTANLWITLACIYWFRVRLI